MKTKFLLILTMLIHGFLLTKLLFAPYPELFVYPYLTNQGLKPYSQILDQHFPGLMFLPINLDNLGMNTPETARAWLILIVLLTHLLIFYIGKQILKSEQKALVVNLLYLAWQPYFEGWVLWIDNFLPLILLPAFYYIYRFSEAKKQRYLILAGLFFGVGVVFKQVLIPFAGLVFLYLFWQQRQIKTFLYFGAGFLPPVFLMVLYFFSIGVFNDFWYWTITYNLTVFNEFGKKPPFFTGLVRICFMLIIAGALIFAKNKKIIQLLLLFIFGSLLAIYARFDFVHFQPALPFVLLATAVGFFGIKEKFGFKKFMVPVICYMLITIWWQNIFYKGHISDQVLFFGADIKQIASIIEKETDPGEKIFIFGTLPHLYQMTKTLPAGDVFVFQFPWFIRVTENRILEGIKRDRPNIIVSDRTVEIEGQKIVDFAPKIDKYIHENYHEFDRVGENRILKRSFP